MQTLVPQGRHLVRRNVIETVLCANGYRSRCTRLQIRPFEDQIDLWSYSFLTIDPWMLVGALLRLFTKRTDIWKKDPDALHRQMPGASVQFLRIAGLALLSSAGLTLGYAAMWW
jgi:hypothetical protein